MNARIPTFAYKETEESLTVSGKAEERESVDTGTRDRASPGGETRE